MTQASFKPIVEPRQPDRPNVRGLEQIAWLMDRAITIPGTRITVGLDALLGLLPVGGDVLTGLIQTGIVLVALFHYRVPRAVAVANKKIKKEVKEGDIEEERYEIERKKRRKKITKK